MTGSEITDSIALAVEKRAELRSLCRTRLSKHISDTLGITIPPCHVRLRTEGDTKYAWYVKDSRIESLFDKQLSRHSVGAFTTLMEEVGHSFWAVHSGEATRISAPTTHQEQLDALRSKSAALAKDLEGVNGALTTCYREKEELQKNISGVEDQLTVTNMTLTTCRQENEVLKRKISELEGLLIGANDTILSSQQEMEKWKTMAEYYQSGMCQWSDGISQISRLLQGLQTATMPLTYT